MWTGDLLRVGNPARGTMVCTRARVADGFLTRLVGLIGKPDLGDEDGLLITPSSGVHTFGMAFLIDIVALDRECRVAQLSRSVGPWRIAGLGFQTRSVLELPDGQIERCGIAIGDLLSIVATHDHKLS